MADFNNSLSFSKNVLRLFDTRLTARILLPNSLTHTATDATLLSGNCLDPTYTNTVSCVFIRRNLPFFGHPVNTFFDFPLRRCYSYQMESLVHKKIVLKLNKHWIPFDTASPYDIMPGLWNGNVLPIHMGYEGDNNMPLIELIDSLDKWISLPVTEEDLYLGTAHGKFKIPSVVVTQYYDKVKYFEPRMSKNNIMNRDRGICQYSGKFVGKNGNIDHVIPVSKGGRTTWENLVWCDVSINTKKGDRTPEEAGLVLLRKPFKPNTFSLNLPNSSKENKHWAFFLKGFHK